VTGFKGQKIRLGEGRRRIGAGFACDCPDEKKN